MCTGENQMGLEAIAAALHKPSGGGGSVTLSITAALPETAGWNRLKRGERGRKRMG